MDLEQYIKDATSTESTVEFVETDPRFLSSTLQIMIASGNLLDLIKKNVFYGREIPIESLVDEFQNIVYSLGELKEVVQGGMEPEQLAYRPRVFHSIVGIATESVELLEALANPDFDRVNFLEELGDLNWYQAIGIDAVDGKFDNVLETNILKLKKSDKARYKDGFNADEANNRDLEAERVILDNVDINDGS